MRDYFIEPFVDTALGNSAYLIGSHATKKGILIDPLRVVTRQSSDVLAIRDTEVAAAMKFIRERACDGISVDGHQAGAGHYGDARAHRGPAAAHPRSAAG